MHTVTPGGVRCATMQLDLTPDVLVPIGAGAALLLAALITALAVRRRARRRAQARTTVADAVREAVGPAPRPEDGPEGPVEPPAVGPAERVGSGRTVAAAVAHALAAREARARLAAPPDPDEPTSGETVREAAALPDPESADPDGAVMWHEPAPAGGGDARDRLLAVLLDDPVRAVGAAVELEACRRQLDRLSDAVRHERHTLGSVLARLADAGLAPDQLARLSGLTDTELRSLLADRVNA